MISKAATRIAMAVLFTATHVGLAVAQESGPSSTTGAATQDVSRPRGRAEVVDELHRAMADGTWELSRFDYPAPYDNALRAHLLARSVER